MVDAGDFLEYANVFGYSYGTSRKDVEKELKRGRHVALVIDTQGAMQLKKRPQSDLYLHLPSQFRRA